MSKEKHAPKLHELLAVESDLDATAKKVMEEAKTTFVKKVDHFLGAHKSLHMFDEQRSQEEAGAAEHKALVTTVGKKLDYIRKPIIRLWDAVLQKDATNQAAVADLVVDGEVIAEALPATWLLGMEQKLRGLRAVYEAIPTHAPGIDWVPDEQRGKGIFKANNPETKDKTEKVVRADVVVPATDHHPAQVREYAENVKVGVFTVERWCGTISPAQKSEYLERIDRLIRAVKKARVRANNAEVKKLTVAKQLFDYVHGS
jgi:hypothetical protein